MHKKFLALVAVAIMVLSVSMVAAQESDLGDIDPSGVTITYWHEWDGEQQVGIDAIITAFNESNEWGITVEQVPLGNTNGVREQVSTGILSGELPNLSGAVFASDAQSYYLDDVLISLDQYYNDPVWGFSEEEIADINQQLLDVNRIQGEPFDGQLLAWPIGQSLNVLSVNMDMLTELGFDAPPADLETFREVACAANELTTADGGDVQGFPIRTNTGDLYSFVLSQGGTIYDGEQYVFTDDAFITVLTFFQDLYNDGCAYIPDGPFVNTADFAFGLNPMAVGSSVGVPFIEGDIESSGSGIENWVNTTTPWSEGNRSLQVFLRSVGMMASTPEEQLATWLFIKHLASTESQITWTEAAQYQPYTTSGLEGLSEEFLTENTQFSSIREILLDPATNLWSAPAHPGSSDVTQIVDNLVAEITTGGRDVMEAATEAEEAANEILADNM